jgi:hypothetical protein
VRVRQFELRLLAVALTILWAAGGGLILIAYRPGGPVDLLVGVAALLPLPVSLAAVVWPPLVRSDRGSAGVFWLGLIAGLLLLPSIAGVGAEVIQGGTQPLLPSFEVTYPWIIALVATSLFAGIGIGRQLVSEPGFGRRRMSAAVAFAVIATSVVAGTFAAVSAADNAALGDMPMAHSRFGPTAVGAAASSPGLTTPADCRRPLTLAGSAHLDLDLSADVDSSGVGTVTLSGNRSGRDVSWLAQVVRSDLFGQYAAARIGSTAWEQAPGTGWTSVSPAALDGQLIDVQVLAHALSAENRITAEDHGLEYVDGARARHCRLAVDGRTFEASFPQVTWLLGSATLDSWRGELDFWIFTDNEVGMVSGSVNGDAQGILEHGLLATVRVKLTAVDRDTTITIQPPRT